jgi:hypothetical protein
MTPGDEALSQGTVPRRGMLFLHRRQIRRDSSPKSPGGAIPEVCTVTRVTVTSVWYRNSTGFRSVTTRADFPGIVLEWIQPGPE